MSKNIVVEFEKILEELVGYPVDMDFKQGFEKDGIENDFIVKIMLCKKLDRIADVLEKIEIDIACMQSSIDTIEQFTECIAQPISNDYEKALRIIGDVAISNY